MLSGLTSLHFGDTNDPNGLVDAQDVALANSFSAMKVVALANKAKRLWEVLGYAADPHIDIPLFFTINADVSVAGGILVDFRYVLD